MARKLKTKVDKNKKRDVDNLYNFYLNSLDEITRRKMGKEVLGKIYKGIEHYSQREFRYLAFDSLVVSSNRIKDYLKEDVGFSKEIGFEKYIELSEKLIKEIAYDFYDEVLNKNILKVMSVNFFLCTSKKDIVVEYMVTDLTETHPYVLDSCKKFTKDIEVLGSKNMVTEEMVFITLKHKKDNSTKYIEVRKVDYDFLQDMSKVLRFMNLVLKTIEIAEDEKEFLESYKECIYTLQRITDYIYFKEIFSMSCFEIPKGIKGKVEEDDLS